MDLHQALEAQVMTAVAKYMPKHGIFIHSLMDEMKNEKLSSGIAGTVINMCLTDAQAKLTSMLTATFHQDINDVAKKAGEALEKAIKIYYESMIKDIGEHNVHADALGKEVPSK